MKNYFYLLPIVVGSIFLALAFTFFQSTKKIVDAGVKVKGTVVHNTFTRTKKGSRQCRPVVDYLFESQKHQYYSDHGSSSCQYKIGETVELYVDPESPSNARINTFFQLWFKEFMFALIGLVAVFAGLFFFLRIQKRKKLKLRLLRYGRVQKAKISDVYKNTSLRINGKSPFVIECQWIDRRTNKAETVKSDNLWFNPLVLNLASLGDEIDVLVDPQNSKLKYVNTTHIEKRYEQLM